MPSANFTSLTTRQLAHRFICHNVVQIQNPILRLTLPVPLDNTFLCNEVCVWCTQITSREELGHFPKHLPFDPLLLISCGYHHGGMQCQSHVISHTICGQRSLMSITQRPHFLMTKEKASSEWVGLLFAENFEFVAAFALLAVFWWGNCWARDNWRGSVKRWLGRRRWRSKEKM